MLGATWAFFAFPMFDTLNPVLIVLAVTIGLCFHALMYAGQPAIMAEIFPTRMRYSGVSLGYQVTSIVAGSLAPIIATALLQRFRSWLPVALYIVAACVITLIAVLTLRETKGLSLRAVDDADAAALRSADRPGSATHDLRKDLTGRRALVTGGASGHRRRHRARAGGARGDGGGGRSRCGGGRRRCGRDRRRGMGGRPLRPRPGRVGEFAARVAGTDILVNNAGVQRIAAIEDFDPEAFRFILRLMVEAPFLLVRAALPGMYERGFGRIVNISSVHGLRASPYKSAYVVAKHGLEGLSKATALEGGEHGVTSNCVNPGYVRTALVEKQVADQAARRGIAESEVLEKVFLTESAIKRLVEPEEVASLVGWLTTDAAAMVTGASYTMDGGWSAR